MAGGFALCVALVPGTAWAEDDPAPAPEDAVTDVLENVPAGAQPGEGQAAEGETLEEESPSEEPPPFEIPPELEAALQQFADQAGFSEECVTGITDSLEMIGNGIAGLPAELQELGTAFGEALQQSITDQDPTALEEFFAEHGLTPPSGGGSPEPPALPIGGDITAGLQQLADTLQNDCQPAPPSEQPEPTDPPAHPVAGPQPPPQNPPAPAPQQPIQQGTYPGYAPTGAEEVEDQQSPAAIALAIAALAGGAVWTGRRWGAARH